MNVEQEETLQSRRYAASWRPNENPTRIGMNLTRIITYLYSPFP
jgi:hypothetical protein